MITETQRKQIDYILDNFNFEKVKVAMEAVDWKWANPMGEPGLTVPTIARMRQTARSLLQKSVKDSCTGTGGFEASYYPDDEDGGEYFTLRFSLHQYSSDGYNDV